MISHGKVGFGLDNKASGLIRFGFADSVTISLDPDGQARRCGPGHENPAAFDLDRINADIGVNHRCSFACRRRCKGCSLV